MERAESKELAMKTQEKLSLDAAVNVIVSFKGRPGKSPGAIFDG